MAKFLNKWVSKVLPIQMHFLMHSTEDAFTQAVQGSTVYEKPFSG